ncbi:MAG: outer membrane protein assembly factor BamD [Rikenellaceae bacterium]
MMKFNFTKVILAALVVCVFASCNSKINKLIKTRDVYGIYYEGLNQFELKKYNKAVQLLSNVKQYVVGTVKEDSLAYYLSTAYYKMGDFETSGQLFNDFRRTYGRSPFLEDVEYMYTMSFYYSSLPANRDQTSTERARVAILEYISRYPNSVKADDMIGYSEELTQRLHDKEYINAKVYYNIGQYKSAVVALQNALDKYPESIHREELMLLILKSNYIYAKNSFEQLQRDRFLVMMDAYYNYTAEYPDSNVKEVESMQAEAREVLAKYDDAEAQNIDNTDKENGNKEE